MPLWASVTLSWVVRGCSAWTVEPRGDVEVHAPMRVLDPEDTVVEVWAGLESAEVRGDVSVHVQGSGGVDVEVSDLPGGLRRSTGAPGDVHPVLRDDLRQQTLP